MRLRSVCARTHTGARRAPRGPLADHCAAGIDVVGHRLRRGTHSAAYKQGPQSRHGNHHGRAERQRNDLNQECPQAHDQEVPHGRSDGLNLRDGGAVAHSAHQQRGNRPEHHDGDRGFPAVLPAHVGTVVQVACGDAQCRVEGEDQEHGEQDPNRPYGKAEVDAEQAEILRQLTGLGQCNGTEGSPGEEELADHQQCDRERQYQDSLT